MKKLLMLLIVLALSLPAYAEVLVYKTTMTGPRFGIDGVKKAKVRGYLVVEVDANTISNLENGQAAPTWGRQILYVKDGRQKWRSVSQSGPAMTYYQPGQKKGTMFFEHSYVYTLGTHQGDIQSAAYGRVRRILIGTGKPKPRIPTKFKGYVDWGGWEGSGCLTMKLASKRTKNANRENKTLDQVVQALDNRLKSEGYDLSPYL
jgi:hypothetical protein